MFKAIALLCVPTLAMAAVAGSPVPDSFGESTAWVQYLNDDFVTHFTDDKLTAGLRGGAKIGYLSLGFQDSMLTWKNNDSRSDEISATIGSQLFNQNGLKLTVAGGWRTAGNYRGQDIQTRWHHEIKEHPVELNYEDHAASFLGTVDASYQIATEDGLGVSPRVSLGFGGDCLEYQTALYVYKDCPFRPDSPHDTFFWFGPVYNGYVGHSLSKTAQEVHRCYDGFMFGLGARLQYAVVNMYLSNDGAYGAIGLEF